MTYDGPYLPLWQIQPTIADLESPYNWDLMSSITSGSANGTAMDVVMKTRQPVIGEPYFLDDPSDPEVHEYNLDEARWLSQYLPNKSLEEIMQPMSDISYPVIAAANERIEWMDDGFIPDDHRVEAFFSVSIFWKDTLANILPEGSNGIIVS